MFRIFILGAILLVAAGPASANRGELGGETGPDATAVTDGPYAAGVTAIDAGDYQGAIGHLTQVVTLQPEHADAFNLLGYANRKLQNYLQALQHYQRALEINPDHTGAHAYIGEAYLELGNLKKAEHHLAKLDLICLFGCDHFFALQEKIDLYRANYSG